jgi:hypothetical protein
MVAFLSFIWLVFFNQKILNFNLVFPPRLAGRVVRDAFENRTRLGPLVVAQRQQFRVHEFLQLCIGPRPGMGSALG